MWLVTHVCASASAVASSLPMPSPPPTSITVEAVSSIPSCCRSSGFGFAGRLKAGLIGKP